MKVSTLTAVAVAGALALPFATRTSADGDRSIVAQSGASGMGAGTTRDGSANKAPSFAELDRNNDGQISRSEWDSHFRSGANASGGATGSGAASGSGAQRHPAHPGPDDASPPTGSSMGDRGKQGAGSPR